jgi:RNA polymerase sigma-32 factor
MDARLGGSDVSLNAPVSTEEETGAERQDLLLSEAPLPDETVSGMIDGDRRTKWLKSALEVLNERELKIIKRRRLSEDGATLDQLGQELGISKERVRQLESRALKKLEEVLVNENPEILRLL